MALGECSPLLLAPERNDADVGHAPVVAQALRLHPHHVQQHVALDHALGGHPLAPGAHEVDLRRLLVGGQVGLEVEAPDGVVVLEDPAAGGEGGAAHHVLARGVAGGVVEAEVGELAGQVGLDVLQLADPGGGLRLAADVGHVLVDPVAEGPGLARGVEDEHRGALHVVALDGAGHPAGEVEHLHPAVVAGDQRALGRGQRDDELALGVLAVHRAAARRSRAEPGPRR